MTIKQEVLDERNPYMIYVHGICAEKVLIYLEQLANVFVGFFCLVLFLLFFATDFYWGQCSENHFKGVPLNMRKSDKHYIKNNHKKGCAEKYTV